MSVAASNPRRRLGKYELVARIGEGGMAEVHLARQSGPRQFEKLVVVKTVRPSLASRPELASMLLDEARIAALVKHPNVVDIYDLGEADGTFFITMEYLEGESLGAVLKAQRDGIRLDPFCTARIIADCAAGLHAAHELRSLAGEPLELVHQDVTPGNVIVLYTGQVKLVDFGVAKVRTSADDGLLKGKTGYLAPELLEGAPADRRSDVFSLGVVLWESLTLRRLFSGKTEAEAVAKIRECNITPPSQLATSVPRDLDEVCFSAMAKDPARRYVNAASMQADLTQILRHASWAGGSEPIGRFMRTTFAERIVARQSLIRELATGRLPRLSTVEQIQAIRDDGPSPSGAEVVGAHGAATSPDIPPAPLPPEPRPRPRAPRVAIGVAIVIGALAGIAFAMSRRTEPSVAAVSIDAGTGASAAHVVPDAAVEVIAAADAGVVVDDRVPVVVVTDADATDAPHSDDATQRNRRDRSKDRHRRDDDDKADDRDGVKAPVSVTARSLYKDGLRQFVAGDVSGAIELFRDAIGRDAGYAPAHRGLGMAYEKKGDRLRARRAFEKYLRLAPDAGDAASIRARMEKLR